MSLVPAGLPLFPDHPVEGWRVERCTQTTIT